MSIHTEVVSQMKLLLSEDDSGGMGWKDRLDAATDLLAMAWDQGHRGCTCVQDEGFGIRQAHVNPYKKGG